MCNQPVFINTTIEKIKVFIFIIKPVFCFRVLGFCRYTAKPLCSVGIFFSVFPNLMFLHSAIDVSEHFTQNQSRPEEITLREDYANDLLFQAGSFGENL